MCSGSEVRSLLLMTGYYQVISQLFRRILDNVLGNKRIKVSADIINNSQVNVVPTILNKVCAKYSMCFLMRYSAN